MKRPLASAFRLAMFVGIFLLLSSLNRGPQAQIGNTCVTYQAGDIYCPNCCSNSGLAATDYAEYEVSGTGTQGIQNRTYSCGPALTVPSSCSTLDYLDDHWSRVREEAKREGALLSYHRVADQGGANTDQTIVLLTEYKDQVTYREREKLFSSIEKRQNLPLVWSLRGNPCSTSTPTSSKA